jgi:hypothetical protein
MTVVPAANLTAASLETVGQGHEARLLQGSLPSETA